MYIVRHSKKHIRLEDIQKQLDSLQQEVNQLKGFTSESITEESIMETPSIMEPVKEVITKSWFDDKNKKFRDGAGGRVSLSFNKIMTLLDNNSVEEVQDVIDNIKILLRIIMLLVLEKEEDMVKRKSHRIH
jgi:predicted transcriptional regulator